MSEVREQILEALNTGQGLPSLPAVAVAILRMSRDPRTSIEKLADVMEKDPALAGKTLRFANSSYYGASKPIVSLPQALIRIGLRGAKMLALSFSLMNSCSKVGAAEFDFVDFWRRSLATSVAARRIADRSVRRLVDEAFIGALLADVGCPAMARTLPRDYRAVGKMLTVGQRDLADIEQRVLGISHPEISSMILKSWHLPEELTKAVAAHHDLEQLEPDTEAFTLAAVIMAASDMADIITRGADPRRVKRLASVFRKYFSFNAEDVDVLLKDLVPEIQEVGNMLDVPLPPIDTLQAEAKGEMLKLAMSDVADGETQAAAAAAEPAADKS